MAEHLESRRLVDYFDADQGTYATTWIEIPPAAMPEGAFRDLAAALTRQSDLPVIAAGRIKRPAMAEEILARGEADLVGMARQLIADPHTVRKMAEGRADEVRLCIGCNDACVAQTSQDKAIRCVHNPFAGRERIRAESHVGRARHARAVLVVGGGPAGLKTAEIAARLGHRVRLLEREAELGGLVRLAARQPYRGEIAAVVDHLALVCDRLGVELQTGVAVDPPLAVALARGADVARRRHRLRAAPPVPLGRRRALARRRERSRAPSAGRSIRPCAVSTRRASWTSTRSSAATSLPGERVLVYDALGSWQAVGTAEYLAERGHRVVLATAAPMVGALLDYGGRVLFLERASALDLELASGVQLESVDDGGAQLRGTHDNRTRRVEADTVVPVLPRRSREDLFLLLRDALPPAVRLARVGDCVAPRFLQAVIAEATSLGLRARRGHRRAAGARMSALPLSVSEWTLRDDDLDRCLARVAALGYDGFELAGRPERAPAAVARSLAASGLQPTSVCTVWSEDRDYAHPEPAARRAAVEYLRACLAWAGEVGARHRRRRPDVPPGAARVARRRARVGGGVTSGQRSTGHPASGPTSGDRATEPLRDAPRAHARGRRGATRGGRPPRRRPAGRRLPHADRGALARTTRLRPTPTTSSTCTWRIRTVRSRERATSTSTARYGRCARRATAARWPWSSCPGPTRPAPAGSPGCARPASRLRRRAPVSARLSSHSRRRASGSYACALARASTWRIEVAAGDALDVLAERPAATVASTPVLQRVDRRAARLQHDLRRHERRRVQARDRHAAAAAAARRGRTPNITCASLPAGRRASRRSRAPA